MNPGFDVMLFDLDGTLIDSAIDIAGAVNHVREKMGLHPLPVELVRSYVGDGVRVLMERALKTEEASVLNQAIALWHPHYEAHCLENTTLYPGILDMLRDLSSRGVEMAVV